MWAHFNWIIQRNYRFSCHLTATSLKRIDEIVTLKTMSNDEDKNKKIDTKSKLTKHSKSLLQLSLVEF